MNLPSPHMNHRPSGPNWSRINQWLLWIGLATAVAWMFYRHNAHLLQLLPFLFVLACPLMHLFGHGGHGGHGGRGGHGDHSGPNARDEERPDPPGAAGGRPH